MKVFVAGATGTGHSSWGSFSEYEESNTGYFVPCRTVEWHQTRTLASRGRRDALALLAEALTKEPLGRVYAESLAQTLALHVVRHYSVSQRAPDMFRGGLSGYTLRRAKEFIDENLEQDLSLAGIAESVGLSQFHFARAFKLTTNITPHQYLTERRVERAKRLLSESDLPIVEVSAGAGFKNQSHFTTLFRRFTGTTPKAWRQCRRSWRMKESDDATLRN